MENFDNGNDFGITGWSLVKATWSFLNVVFDHSAPVLAHWGLHQKSLVLLALLDLGDTPQELAHLLRSPASTLSSMLRELEDKGLIARSLDQADRRRFRLRRTAEGDRALSAGIAAIDAAVGGCLNSLGDEDRAAVTRALPLLLRLSAAAPAKSGDVSP